METNHTRRPVGSRVAPRAPKLSIAAIMLAIVVVAVALFILSGGTKVTETYTEDIYIEGFGSSIHQSYTREETYFQSRPSSSGQFASGRGLPQNVLTDEKPAPAIVAAVEVIPNPEEPSVAEASEEAVETEEIEEEPVLVLHFPESWYIKGAIMLTGEAGGVKSLTEQSGCLWTAINRVMSDDPFYPDDFEAVIEQKWQFDGYTPGGTYYEQCYELTVDVLERWYREMNGETAEEVGRTLPVDYLFFTGDGHHNYFTKVQNGTPYVWGSQLVSPYET